MESFWGKIFASCNDGNLKNYPHLTKISIWKVWKIFILSLFLFYLLPNTYSFTSEK